MDKVIILPNVKYSKYTEFFKQATKSEKYKDGFSPYAYQQKLAEDRIPTILSIPTGCGKTEAAILAWLWRRRIDESNTSRKLVYCLPMRTLVEQTVERVIMWLKNLNIRNVNVVALIGGNANKISLENGIADTDSDWVEEPEADTIIIGTQDMLLSRALNRGYGISPYRWPIEFGLINNDCMWVIDEVQLMNNGLATTLQLQAFRKKYGTFGPCSTMWMSATISKSNMQTVDFKTHVDFPKTKSNTEKITDAKKPLKKISLNPKKYEYGEKDVSKILSENIYKPPMLIIVNNVKRAQSLFKLIKKEHNAILVHSRFRPHERRIINKKISNIKKNEKTIIISTQAIEAGVDLSSHTMVTEIAPVSSMIQRFGRCNRKGEYEDAVVYWIESDLNNPLPYEENELKKSLKWLQNQESASSSQIKSIEDSTIYDTVIRRSDLEGLFDTSPDITGSYIDVSKFVRESTKSSDVNVYWRKADNEKPKYDMRKHTHDEICSVPIWDFQNFVKQIKDGVWYYDYRNEDQMDNPWEKVNIDDIQPGRTFLIDASKGGYSEEFGWSGEPKPAKLAEVNDFKVYSEEFGWSGEPKSNVNPIKQSTQVRTKDHDTTWKCEYRLEEHSKKTRDKMNLILEQLENIDEDVKKVLREAALFHDIGKAHAVFQNTMKELGAPSKAECVKNTPNHSVKQSSKHANNDPDNIFVKSPPEQQRKKIKHGVKNFRHEVASALVYLDYKHAYKKADLVAFLIAAHHGKVRMSFRTRQRKEHSDDMHLLGFNTEEPWDELQKITIEKENIPETKIDMSIASIGDKNGKESWTARVLKLLDEYGPFRLGYMEAILRIADIGASKEIEQ